MARDLRGSDLCLLLQLDPHYINDAIAAGTLVGTNGLYDLTEAKAALSFSCAQVLNSVGSVAASNQSIYQSLGPSSRATWLRCPN